MTQEEVERRITARNLGYLALETACERCFWWKLQLRNRFPFMMGMPGIMFFAEQMERAIIANHFANGAAPPWFGPFADVVGGVQQPSPFKFKHDSGLYLSGVPDAIFCRKDSTIVVLDYKTAKARENDPFGPQYAIQVTGYALIAEKLGLGSVSGAGLIYFDVQHQQVKDSPSSFVLDDGFFAPFKAVVHPIKLDYGEVDRLLYRAANIWSKEAPPAGRDGCNDCRLLSRLLDADLALHQKDEFITRFFPEYATDVIRRGYERDCARLGNPKSGVPLVGQSDGEGYWNGWQWDTETGPGTITL